jgi:hypothetical protein
VNALSGKVTKEVTVSKYVELRDATPEYYVCSGQERKTADTGAMDARCRFAQHRGQVQQEIPDPISA